MNPESYQKARTQLIEHVDRLRNIRDDLATRDPIFINSLSGDVRQKMLLLDRESSRLRNPDLTIAFVGGFSAGKSSLVNAFLGRYLLPESTKITTAVPTFIRTTASDECAELHYLDQSEVEDLEEMYRKEIAAVFDRPELANMPFTTLIEQTKNTANEGRGKKLLEQFDIFQAERKKREISSRGQIIKISIDEAYDKIRDEKEAMFLDRIVLKINKNDIPEDTVLVDLPGISVPNPRHREITFRFIRQEANAVVFVLMATRLFDKDEVSIMELFRSGETHISQKTFWVLNRWDALSPQQQQQTLSDFETKMKDFSVPSGYKAFRTNALHGLLAQLKIKNESPSDLALQSHLKDYEECFVSRYSSSHSKALQDSQITSLQKEVLVFLNDHLRRTTLHSAFDNAKTNFIDPISHHLRSAKEDDDKLITKSLSAQEKDLARKRIESQLEKRAEDIKSQLRELRNDIALRRSGVLIEKTKDLVDQLREKIEKGPETDAFQIYQEIIAGRELRKYPYHFEIEMQIVDNLNTLLKRSFRSIVRSQVESVFEELTVKIENTLEKIGEDVNYTTEVMSSFKDVLDEEASSFSNRVDGVVMTLAAQLDELLLYKPKSFMTFLKGNEILEGLEEAAKMGFENLKASGQSIKESDFSEKTKKIRETLSKNYIEKVAEYHEHITHDIFPIIINNMQQIEERLLDALKSKYRSALEIVISQKISEEFSEKKKDIEKRSQRFRGFVDEIDQAMIEMKKILTDIESLPVQKLIPDVS